MTRRRSWIAGVLSAQVLGLAGIAAGFAGCTRAEEVEPKAEAVDASVPHEDAPKEGAKKPHETPHSLAVSGRGQHSLHNFTMNDKQGREVVRLKKASGSTDVNALQRGTFHVTNAKIEGVELTLYRDETGKLSLVGALKQQPPTVRDGLMVPPTDKPKKGTWLMEVGPIEVKDATLTIGFTKKPVIFHVDSAKITVRRRPKEAGPVIYLHEVQGHMLKPKPLPKPVRIAWASTSRRTSRRTR